MQLFDHCCLTVVGNVVKIFYVFHPFGKTERHQGTLVTRFINLFICSDGVHINDNLYFSPLSSSRSSYSFQRIPRALFSCSRRFHKQSEILLSDRTIQ